LGKKHGSKWITLGNHQIIREDIKAMDSQFSSSWSQDEVKAALSGKRSRGTSWLIESIRQPLHTRQTSRASLSSGEWPGFFSNVNVIKESVLEHKVKTMEDGRKAFKRRWEVMWFRLFPNALIGYEKKVVESNSTSWTDASATPALDSPRQRVSLTLIFAVIKISNVKVLIGLQTRF
jgi:hypothetical protein